jgi:hypothetical protein
VTEPSKARNVFTYLNTEIVGSSPTRGNGCLCAFIYSVFMLSCVGSGFATGWSPVQGVLPTIYHHHHHHHHWRDSPLWALAFLPTIYKIHNFIINSQWEQPESRIKLPIGLWDVEAPTCSRLTDGGEVVSLTRRPAVVYPQEDSWYSFLLEAKLMQGLLCSWKD